MSIRTLLLVSGLAFGTTAAAQASEVFIEQAGTSNVATVTQTASAAFLMQAGLSNQATIEQVGTGGHLVRLDQTGGSFAEVFQSGSGNRLVGLDGLVNPESWALQADASRLFLTQIGTDNSVFLDQAAGAFARITQNGSNNTVTVIQTGP